MEVAVDTPAKLCEALESASEHIDTLNAILARCTTTPILDLSLDFFTTVKIAQDLLEDLRANVDALIAEAEELADDAEAAADE
jgi:hypothetical protein